MRTFRVIELFSGVGAQRMALERVKARHPGEIDFEFVAQCDIDRHAVRSYNAIHGEKTPNLGDISKVEALPDCDILTYSFPCTDLSLAGSRRGMERGSGTHSALIWEVERLLLAAKHRPEWLVMENVPQVLSAPGFAEWLASLQRMGYASTHAKINAKDHGVAQNRERVFMVSHLGAWLPNFPRPIELEHRLRDYLEQNPGDKYYLKPERLERMILSTKIQRERERIRI